MWIYCSDWSGSVISAVFLSHTLSFYQASWASVQRLLSVRDEEMTWWGSAGSGAVTSECGHFTSGPHRQSKGLSGSKHRSYLSKPPLTAGSSGLSLCLTSCGLQIMFLFRGKHGKRQKPLLFRWRISNMGGFMCLLTQTWVLKWWLLFQAKQQCSHDVLTPVVHERWWYYWCDTIRYEVIRYEAIRYEAIRYDMIWYDTIQLYWYWRAVVS